jgi:hypothetical protein
MTNNKPNNNGIAIARQSNGRFAVGHAGGPGRPPLGETQRELAESIRKEIRRYKLVPERMAQMAAGVGKYAKLGAKTQHAITMDLMAYGYGRPPQIVYNDIDAELTFVKRIVGVNEADI